MSRLRVVVFMLSFSAASGQRALAESYVTEMLNLIHDGRRLTYST